MKVCPKCGYVIENDNAKFCRKCGAKQPEFDSTKGQSPIPSPTKINNVNDGILLGQSQNYSIEDDGGQSLSGIKANDEPIQSPFPSSNEESVNKGMLWAIKTCFSKYVVFHGRASRSEYWYFYLFNCIIYAFLIGLALIINLETISMLLFGAAILYMLVVTLPGLAVSVRRLHDIGKSGWLFCVSFIPYVGALILLYFLCKKGDDGDNMYGAPE